MPTAEGNTAKNSQVLAVTQDEVELLESYRKAKQIQYADIEITIQEGRRTKLWLTEKMR